MLRKLWCGRVALLPSFVVKSILRLSDGPSETGSAKALFSSNLEACVSGAQMPSIWTCAPYFSFKPTPALAFFPWTDTVASSKPQAEATAKYGAEAAINAKVR